MSLSDFLIQRFLELCPIPELYSGMGMGAIAVKVKYTPPYLTEIIIHCQNVFLARQISEHYNVLNDAIKQLDIAAVSISFNNQLFRVFMNEPLMHSVNQEIIDSQVRQAEENRRHMETLNHQEIDLNSLWRSSNPSYIITMTNNILVYANDAALEANQKTLDEFVGENFTALNFPEELERLKRFLRMDKKLTNYEMKSMNWYKDGEDWRRKAINIVADIQLIDFGKKICRLGTDLMVEETRRFLD